MRQLLRFLVRPSIFFNQLQWSSHHWFIIFAFLGIASVETHIGKYHQLYSLWVTLFQARLGLSFDTALWLVTALRLTLIFAGSFLVAHLVWLVGNMIGTRNSKRVLFRRLAVVFTVFLSGYTAAHLSPVYPFLSYLSFALYFWALSLGYFAIREQFALSHLETVVVGVFAALLVVSSWHFSTHLLESAAYKEMKSLSARPGPTGSSSIR